MSPDSIQLQMLKHLRNVSYQDSRSLLQRLSIWASPGRLHASFFRLTERT